jgi:hypothetical protein
MATPKTIQGMRDDNDQKLFLIIANAGGPITRSDVERAAYKQGFTPHHHIRVCSELGYIASPDIEKRTLALTEKGAAAYDAWKGKPAAASVVA